MYRSLCVIETCNSGRSAVGIAVSKAGASGAPPEVLGDDARENASPTCLKSLCAVLEERWATPSGVCAR